MDAAAAAASSASAAAAAGAVAALARGWAAAGAAAAVAAERAEALPRGRQLALAAGVGLGLGAGVGFGLARLRGPRRRGAAGPGPAAGPAGDLTRRPKVRMGELLRDEVLQEHFTRNIQFFGEAGQERISGAFVVVVGLGGVGSHAAHLLLRSGVGKLRIVDFDQVSLSSLNRHAVATRADVGVPKAACLQRHFAAICPEIEVEALNCMYTDATEDVVLAGAPDYVLDAIDNIDTKVALLAACKRRGLPVLCCAGAGAKVDPTRIRLADLTESSADRLARAVRTRLKRDHGIAGGIEVLFSLEKPRVGLVPFDDSGGERPLDYQVVPGFRVRTIPVLGTLPAIFGMAAATAILTALAGAPLDPEPVFRLQAKQYGLILEDLREREAERFGAAGADVQVDVDEVTYLVRELWRGCSARLLFQGPEATAKGFKGLWRSTFGLCLERWDERLPARVDNLVMLRMEEAEEHAGLGLAKVRAARPEFAAFVEGRLARARREMGILEPP